MSISKSIVFIAIMSFTCLSHAQDCKRIEIKLEKGIEKILLDQMNSKLNISESEITKAYTINNWYFINLSPAKSDDLFFFFYGQHPKYLIISSYGGSPTNLEEPIMKEWAILNNPGIPDLLASCYARYISIDRYHEDA